MKENTIGYVTQRKLRGIQSADFKERDCIGGKY
jgi:hypothetical protein